MTIEEAFERWLNCLPKTVAANIRQTIIADTPSYSEAAFATGWSAGFIEALERKTDTVNLSTMPEKALMQLHKATFDEIVSRGAWPSGT